jgi:hypothetical protein
MTFVGFDTKPCNINTDEGSIIQVPGRPDRLAADAGQNGLSVGCRGICGRMKRGSASGWRNPVRRGSVGAKRGNNKEVRQEREETVHRCDEKDGRRAFIDGRQLAGCVHKVAL